jgi:5-methylthioadenosine/S-adenosylhomocysteine deaminase
MLRSGTTTFNDMYYFEDVAARLAKQMHIRAVLSEGLIDFPSPSFAKSSDGVAFVRELLQEYRNDELVTIAVAAHTPFTCSTGLLQGTKRLADEFGVPWHIHLAETRWEFDKYMRESGLTPTQYLDSLGVLGPNTVAAHGVHLTEGDMDLLALRGSGVAHNPVCNMKLASGVAPITPMWERGVTVGIATDGAASTNSLDLWKELRTAALLQKLITGNPAAAEASRMVRMATIDGARLLGLDSKMGSLEVGKRADMITVDLHSEHSLPLFSVYSHLVYSMNALDVREVWVDGHQVLRSGKFVTIDTDAIYAEIKEVSREIAAFDRSHNTK